MLKDHDVGAVLPAEDLERARRFYEETLRFEPESADPQGVMYRSGSSVFTLYPTQYAGLAQHTQAGWLVEDLRAMVTELRERGIRFEEYDFPGLKRTGSRTSRASWPHGSRTPRATSSASSSAGGRRT
jgi:hypothetical protein